MSKSSKRKAEPPAPSMGDHLSLSQATEPDVPAPAAAAVAPPPAIAHVHGPRKPRVGALGVDRLRRVMSVSAEVSTDTLCGDAATELEKLRKQAHKPAPWSEDR